jgi:hypothetical protein
MRNVKWLLAAGLIAATTAACTTDTGYPTTSYNSGYYAPSTTGYYAPAPTSSGYYAPAPTSSGYYAPAPRASSGYYAPTTVSRRGPNGDYDRDGIPNKYDRDANGDGIPDKYQR